MVTSTFTRARLTRIGVPAAAFLGLTLLRTHDIAGTFCRHVLDVRRPDPLLGVGAVAVVPAAAQRDRGTRGSVYPLPDLLLAGPVDPGHAGTARRQPAARGRHSPVVLHSAIDALLLFALWTKTRSSWLALAATLFITTAPYDLALSATLCLGAQLH